jgi:ubiquinone biosynthesis protein COQ4
MKKTYYFFSLWANVIRIAANANNTSAALRVADCLYHLGLLDKEMETIMADAKSNKDVRDRKFMAPYQLAELDQLPEGTLGKAYARHMLGNQLKPDFYDRIEVTDDNTYIMMRMRETHDLWHVITGFGTSVPHELGLQAFMFAQILTPLAPILICARSLISVFKNPSEVLETFDQVSKGWVMGRRSRLIFALDWENSWKTPLQDLRSQYGISV